MLNPPTPDILYHYCSIDAFQSIIQSRRIWLSDLSKSNDSQEGKIASRIILDALKEDYGHTRDELDFIQKDYERIARGISCMGISLSAKKDRLSQWRGYGDDGKGIALGFSGKWLIQTSYLRPVYYSKEDQTQLISAHIRDLSTVIKNNDLASVKKRLFTIGQEILYQYKDDFFSEEDEWRLKRNVTKKEPYLEIKRRHANGKIISFFELPLLNDDPPLVAPISHVLLGPKNNIPKKFFLELLDNNGFTNEINVCPSRGSYQ